MTEPRLALAKLPDRTPVKISISVSPDLYADLRDYAEAYQTTYGSSESVAELIPFMLAAFIKSDTSFRKARRDRRRDSPRTAGGGRSLTRRGASAAATASNAPVGAN